jgi:hypothetical protein
MATFATLFPAGDVDLEWYELRVEELSGVALSE